MGVNGNADRSLRFLSYCKAEEDLPCCDRRKQLSQKTEFHITSILCEELNG